MDAALGYYTVQDFIDPSMGCGGAYYSRSFAIGMCIVHENSSSLYNYDGSEVTNYVFDTETCDGNVTSKTVLPLSTCTLTPSNSSLNPNGFYQTASYNTELPTYDVAGVDGLGFQNQQSCLAGGYMETQNWFPLNQCMWFEYFKVYVKFTGCESVPTTSSYDGTVGVFTRAVYNDSACSVQTQAPQMFSQNCSLPPPGESVLLESYLSKCSSTCASTTTAVTESSDCECSYGTKKLDAILGVSVISMLLVVGIVIAIFRGSRSQGIPLSGSDVEKNRNSL